MLSRRLLLAVASVTVLLMSTAPAQAAFPGLNGKIAFSHTPGNPGTSRDIYVMQPDGSGVVPITGLPDDEDAPAWSADGTKIAFVRGGDVWVMNSDGSGAVNLTTALAGVSASPSWSPDGAKLAFSSTHSGTFGQNIYTMNSADGSDVTRVSFGTPDQRPVWSPDGQRIAFVRPPHIITVRPDGTDVMQVTSGISATDPDWSPSSARITYAGSGGDGNTRIHIIDADGSNDVTVNPTMTDVRMPAWSPDGSKLVFSRNSRIWTMNADGTGAIQLTTNIGNNREPDWQPLPFTGYARPKGASPMYLSLVPAYVPCSSPDREHGPPLVFPSCTASQTSPNLTVGTPDANGAAANSIGALTFTVAVGTPGPPDDSDVKINLANVTDVRCAAALDTCGSANAAGGPDYTGQLQVRLRARLTDKAAATAGAEPTTTVDFDFPATDASGFPFRLSCAATADPSIGATCNTITTFNALVPGSVKDTRRAMWEFVEQVEVFDGGTDGVASTEGDNSLFAVPGVFVP